jgi:hypothetical protein
MPITVVARLPEDGRTDRRVVELRLQEPFRPFALVLWGAGTGKVRDIKVGAEPQLMTTIPGCLFESELSFDEFDALLQPRPGIEADPHPMLTSFRDVGLIFRLDMPPLAVGESLGLDIEGGYDHGLYIGEMLSEATREHFMRRLGSTDIDSRLSDMAFPAGDEA